MAAMTDPSAAMDAILRAKSVEQLVQALAAGIDVNAKNEHGMSLLHAAVVSKKLKLVEVILNKQPDVNATNKDGESPLHFWAGNALDPKIAGLLLDRGANVEARDRFGVTPLGFALMNKTLKQAEYLVGRGAALETRDGEGCTPLHRACQPLSGRGQLRIGQIGLTAATFLLDRGASCAPRNNFEETPLHLAAKWGSLELVTMLIDRGADVNAQNKNGKSVVEYASDEAIKAFLATRGAEAR